MMSWAGTKAPIQAQVVLAIDGAFLAFLTSAIFSKPDDLKSIIRCFSGLTWFLLALMAVCLLASVASAIYCLWSRIYSAARLGEVIASAQPEMQRQDIYAPQTVWFFQMLATLDPKRFHATLEGIDDRFEIEALGAQIQILSGNVRDKHRAVNLGFVFAAATMILFFFAGLSYMAQCTV